MGTIILGSGISGISAGYHLEKAGEPVVIYEKIAIGADCAEILQ